jgi:hypothetical protein
VPWRSAMDAAPVRTCTAPRRSGRSGRRRHPSGSDCARRRGGGGGRGGRRWRGFRRPAIRIPPTAPSLTEAVRLATASAPPARRGARCGPTLQPSAHEAVGRVPRLAQGAADLSRQEQDREEPIHRHRENRASSRPTLSARCRRRTRCAAASLPAVPRVTGRPLPAPRRAPRARHRAR